MSLSYLPQKHYTSAETRHPPISFIITISSMIMQFNTAHVYIYFNQLLRFLFFDRATTHAFSGTQGPDPSVPTTKTPAPEEFSGAGVIFMPPLSIYQALIRD